MIHAILVAWWDEYKKKVKQGSNACSMARKKMVRLVHARRPKERNKTIFIDEK